MPTGAISTLHLISVLCNTGLSQYGSDKLKNIVHIGYRLCKRVINQIIIMLNVTTLKNCWIIRVQYLVGFVRDFVGESPIIVWSDLLHNGSLFSVPSMECHQ